MNQNKYQFIDYQPEYKNQILRLLTVLWGDDLKLNNAYFDWKYLENPYSDKVRINLALHDRKVAGVRAHVAMRWQAGQPKKEMLCLADADAVVHPDHRRQGLLHSMTLAALEDMAYSSYEYIFTLSANKITAPFILQRGWRDAGFLQTAQYLRAHGESPQSSLRKTAFKLPLLPSIYRRFRPRTVSKPQESHVRLPTFHTFDANSSGLNGSVGSNISARREPEPEPMANLIDQFVSDGRIQHVRDQAYFAWRYKNPRSTYRFIFYSSKQLEGYLVLRAPSNGTSGLVTIVDWAAKSITGYSELLESAIKWGGFYAINIWSETLSEDARQLLIDNNFRFLEAAEDETSGYRPPQLILRPVREGKLAGDWDINGLNLLDLRNWDLRAIDSDGN